MADGWIDVDPIEAGLPVGRGEPLVETLVLKRVGVPPEEEGLRLELLHAPTNLEFVLDCEPRSEARPFLAADERLAVSVVGNVPHEVACAVREALPRLAGVQFRSATRRQKLKVMRGTSWERSLGETPGTLKVSDACDERCAFCSSPLTGYADGSMPPDDLVRDTIVHWAEGGLGELQFVDREPTLNPRLASYIALAREAGFRWIRLNTNGFLLAEGTRLDEYVAAGLSEVCFSLHGADAATSDRITGREGGFEPKLAAIRRALGHPKLKVVVNVVVTAENVQKLPAIAALLLERYRDLRLPDLSLSFVGPVGDGASRSDLLPRYEECRPSVEEVLARYPVVDVHRAYGPPPCRFHLRFLDRIAPDSVDTLGAGRSWLPGCDACRLRPRCHGIWTAYLERYGEAGFDPVT
jgi:MoaA/NifB/PqqE/SkfB family radical SAM enzyme